MSLIVKDSGMRVEEEKKGGKEDGSPTMPLMLFSFYRVIRSWRKGRDFFAKLEYKQDGIPSCNGCGHKKVVFYDHYYRKAKLASIDGRIRKGSADRVWEACGNDKRMVCADNKNVEIYKK